MEPTSHIRCPPWPDGSHAGPSQVSAPAESPQPSLFIVGCGRSGTTVLYEAIARHPDAAWFSTWTNRTLRPEFAVFNSLFKRRISSRRYGPRPSEGYRLWDSALDLAAGAAVGVLGRGEATPESARCVQAVIDRHRRFGRGSLFVNKNTRNSRRVLF